MFFTSARLIHTPAGDGDGQRQADNGSAGQARILHKAISQVESNCTPPDSRIKQNEGMLERVVGDATQ